MHNYQMYIKKGDCNRWIHAHWSHFIRYLSYLRDMQY